MLKCCDFRGEMEQLQVKCPEYDTEMHPNRITIEPRVLL
jgi:hypothetical protein